MVKQDKLAKAQSFQYVWNVYLKQKYACAQQEPTKNYNSCITRKLVHSGLP